MRYSKAWRQSVLWLGIWLLAHQALAINVQIDYTYDTSNFFGSGNPQGAVAGSQARAALEAAASFYSTILTNEFDAITVPAPYHSSVPGSAGVVIWNWQAQFPNPSDSSGTQVVIPNPTVNADQYIVYAGARSYPDNKVGQGAPGTFLTSEFTVGNSFTTPDIENINSIGTSFVRAVNARGQTSGFVRWGGSIGFDNDSSTSWFFDHTSSPSANSTDFYSVAIHELAHTLGFGESKLGPSIQGEINTTVWPSLVTGLSFSGLSFSGANAVALNGGSPVPLFPDEAHWMPGQMSVVYATSIPQEAAMVPDLQMGTRKLLTELDAAALKDLGWSLGPVPEPPTEVLTLIVVLVSCFAPRRLLR